ncbi:hypothetical protein ATY81_16310 [Rhizobium sp. R72]|nr:hypothetical protein ATY81_16310 [Rhizobium sp. R72]OWV92933.1 hypothetical protein ATY80_16310 [Rhizobium sp. R711]
MKLGIIPSKDAIPAVMDDNIFVGNISLEGGQAARNKRPLNCALATSRCHRTILVKKVRYASRTGFSSLEQFTGKGDLLKSRPTSNTF